MKNKQYSKDGKLYFERFERNVTERPRSFRLYAEEKAADLLSESPLVVDTLYEHGLLNKDEHHSKFILVFRVNLAGQKYAIENGKGGLFITKNVADRAAAMTGYLQQYRKSFMQAIKARNKTVYDVYYALRDMFSKENLQIDYISGVPLKPSTETIAGVAVHKRISKLDSEYKKLVKALGANPDDDYEMADFVREGRFRDFIYNEYKREPFYNRRSGVIETNRGSIVTDDFDIIEPERDVIPLFKRGKVGEEFRERALVHFIHAFGLNPHKIASMLTRHSVYISQSGSISDRDFLH